MGRRHPLPKRVRRLHIPAVVAQQPLARHLIPVHGAVVPHHRLRPTSVVDIRRETGDRCHDLQPAPPARDEAPDSESAAPRTPCTWRNASLQVVDGQLTPPSCERRSVRVQPVRPDDGPSLIVNAHAAGESVIPKLLAEGPSSVPDISTSRTAPSLKVTSRRWPPEASTSVTRRVMEKS